MSQSWRSDDPDAALEADKYANPVPSRSLINQHLHDRDAGASYEVLIDEFELADENEQEGLRRRLIAMVRDGQLLRCRDGLYTPINEADLCIGTVKGHRDGFGFLVPDDQSAHLFLTAHQMKGLLDGDRIAVHATNSDGRGRSYCVVVNILKRGPASIVGLYYVNESGQGYVRAESRRMTNDLCVQAGALQPLPGQVVLLDIKEYPTPKKMAVGVVREILGERMDAGMEIEIALRSHEIPYQWPLEVEKAAQRFSSEVNEKDKAHRVDLRQTPFVTIDGEDARDFDDAVFAQTKKSGGWRLFVAIADVSHYVRPASAIDDEARNRSTSVYFPGTVIPMLPEILSNGLCSLNPHTDRLALVCEMTISQNGTLSGYRFYEGVICSHARLTYTQVDAMLRPSEQDGAAALREQFKEIVGHIDQLHSLYQTLRTARERRGAIDFDTTETRIVFDQNRKIETITPVVRNDAHRMIEESMLCANVAAARFLQKHKVPILYRNHEGPAETKLANVHSFLGELGLSLPGGRELTATDYQNLIHSVAGRPDVHVIQMMLLRSLSQACYSPDNIGHFGLSYPAYTHFTSPIRRYPDLLVHRAIRSVVRSDQPSRHVRRLQEAPPIPKKKIFPYNLEDMQALGEHCSMAERRADNTARDVVDWLKCEYMQNHLGEVYQGVIATVTGFGFFVELTDVFVTGLVHISTLTDDYYHFEAARQRLVGENTASCFRLGDSVTIRVVRIDLDQRSIDFELHEQADTGSGRTRRRQASRRKAPVGKSGDKGPLPQERQASDKRRGGTNKRPKKRGGPKQSSEQGSVALAASTSNPGKKRRNKGKKAAKKRR